MGYLLKLFGANPLLMLWIGGGIFLVAFALGGAGAWTVQGWRMKAQETEWQTREAKINAETAIKIEAAAKRVAAAEHAHAQALSAVDTKYQAKLKEKDHALEIALNGLRDGTGRMFVRAACPTAGGDNLPGSKPGASVGDGGTRVQLSATDSEFLLRLGSEADGIVAQLTACQSVIAADRK